MIKKNVANTYYICDKNKNIIMKKHNIILSEKIIINIIETYEFIKHQSTDKQDIKEINIILKKFKESIKS